MKKKAIFTSLIFACLLHLPASAEDDSFLSLLIPKKGHVVYGEIEKEDDNQVTIFDIVKGESKSFKKDALKEVRKNVTDVRAIASIGSSPVIAWRTSKLLRQKPIQCKISDVSALGISVSAGSETGIEKGQTLYVLGPVKVITDPDTGEVLGRRSPRIAKLQVKEAQTKYSLATLQGDVEVDLRVGQVVESLPQSQHIAVLPFLNAGGQSGSSEMRFNEDIVTAMSNLKIPIVDRKNLQRVLGELSIQQSSLFDRDKAQKIGKQVGAYAVLMGRFLPKGNSHELFVRLVKVQTGQIISSKKIVLTKKKYRPSLISHTPGIIPASPKTKRSVPSKTESVLFFSDQGNIYRSNLDGTNASMIFESSQRNGSAVWLDVDTVNKKIYWRGAATQHGGVYSEGVIGRMNYNGTKAERVMTKMKSSAYGFALDLKNKRFYFGVHSLKAGIFRANLNGTGKEVVANTSSSDKKKRILYTHGIDISSTKSKLYFSDGGPGVNGIKVANLDGSNPVTVVSRSNRLGRVTIALDEVAGKIYFAGEQVGSIFRCNLDGTKQELFLEGIPGVYALEIDELNRMIYWTRFGALQRASLNDRKIKTLMKLSKARFSTGIALDIARKKRRGR